MKKTSNSRLILRLISVIGSLFYVMILAVLNGSLGFLTSMGVVFFGSCGIAKNIDPLSVNMPFWLIYFLIISLGIIRGVLRYFEQYSNHYIAFKLLSKLRSKIFDSLRRLAPTKLETKEKGNLISMLTSDIETLEVFYAHTLSPVLIAFTVSIIVILVSGFLFSWYFSLVGFIGYIIIGVVVPFSLAKSLKKEGSTYREEVSNFSGYYLDSVKGIREIVLNQKQKERIDEIDKRSLSLSAKTKKIQKKSGLSQGISEMAVSSIILFTILTAVGLFFLNKITLSKAIMGSILILSSFGPVIALAALPGALVHTFPSAKRYINLIDEKPIVEKIYDKNDFDFKKLEVKDLVFGYDEKNIIEGLSLNLEVNKIISIVGKSGSGKSTLLKLLLRIFKKKEGQIKYNGIDIEEINTDSLYDNISFVNQNVYLFDKTIKENIKIAKLEATDEEVINAAKKASIHDFIMSLDKGYDTVVQQLGDNLSSGEKQRIGLARAFLKDSPCIFLDEPTSNVDAINEGIILKSLLNNKKDKAIIIVSHRLSTVEIADEIYEFKNKKLIKKR